MFIPIYTRSSREGEELPVKLYYDVKKMTIVSFSGEAKTFLLHEKCARQ